MGIKGFIKGFLSSNRRGRRSRHGRNYGGNRYSHGSNHHHKQSCQTVYKKQCTYQQKQECQHTYKTVTTYENKKECKTVYRKEQKCQTTYKDDCSHDNHGSNGGYNDYDGIDLRYRAKRDGYSRKTIKCKKVPHRNCQYVSVPDTRCDYVKVPRHSQVPDKKCHYVKVPNCHQVPQKKCHTTTYKPRKRYGSRRKSHHNHHKNFYRG